MSERAPLWLSAAIYRLLGDTYPDGKTHLTRFDVKCVLDDFHPSLIDNVIDAMLEYGCIEAHYPDDLSMGVRVGDDRLETLIPVPYDAPA